MRYATPNSAWGNSSSIGQKKTPAIFEYSNQLVAPLFADRRRQKWRRIGRHERDHIPLCHLESPVGAGTVVVGVPHRHKAQAVSFRFLSGQFSAQFTGDCTGRLMTLDHSGGRGFPSG